MAVRNTIAAIPMTSIESTTVTGTYAVINAGGTPQACFLIRIINDSDEDVTVSYDGVNDADYIPTMTSIQLPLQTNSQPNNNVALLTKGTQVWVKGTMGTGYVYLSGYYSIPSGV